MTSPIARGNWTIATDDKAGAMPNARQTMILYAAIGYLINEECIDWGKLLTGDEPGYSAFGGPIAEHEADELFEALYNALELAFDGAKTEQAYEDDEECDDCPACRGAGMIGPDRRCAACCGRGYG